MQDFVYEFSRSTLSTEGSKRCMLVFLRLSSTLILIRSLRSCNDCCNENITSKYSCRLSVSQIFHVGHVVKCVRNVLSLIGANVFHVKAENERLTAAGSRCRQNLKPELFTFRKIALKCVPHVQHDYFSSFTQSYHWFEALLLMLPSSFLSTLPFAKVAVIWVY